MPSYKFTIHGIPPTVNTYWRRNGHRYFISKAGIDYKRLWALQAPRIAKKVSESVELNIVWFRPDKRRRDADNVLKPILDCLSDTMLEDDSLVDILRIDKSPSPDKINPRIEIALSTIED